MRNLKTFILTVCVLFIAGTINAQKIKLISGSLDALKSETSINVEFTYDKNMQVGKKTEATYVAEKKEEYNKKEAGKGDQWALSWVADRKEKYEVKTYSFDSKSKQSETFDFTGKETDISQLFSDIENNYANKNIGAIGAATKPLH